MTAPGTEAPPAPEGGPPVATEAAARVTRSAVVGVELVTEATGVTAVAPVTLDAVTTSAGVATCDARRAAVRTEGTAKVGATAARKIEATNCEGGTRPVT